jgi:hypothetical protein
MLFFYSFTRDAFAPTQGHMRHFYALLFLWFECFQCLYLGMEEVPLFYNQQLPARVIYSATGNNYFAHVS